MRPIVSFPPCTGRSLPDAVFAQAELDYESVWPDYKTQVFGDNRGAAVVDESSTKRALDADADTGVPTAEPDHTHTGWERALMRLDSEQ